MNVVIVEDERPAAERLERALREYSSRIEVIARLQTVADTVAWFKTHEEPDLVFLDVQLSDGVSLNVFKECAIGCPVIFTTAYDAYVLDAFECNSIDYVLKPIRADRIATALDRYERLRRHFGADAAELLRDAVRSSRREYRKRLLLRRGNAFVSVETSEVAYAYSDHKSTFVVDTAGRRYLADEAVTALEDILDPLTFFRLNRKYIAHVNAIASFRSASRGRLRVELKPSPSEVVLVSQEKAGRFRAWMER